MINQNMFLNTIILTSIFASSPLTAETRLPPDPQTTNCSISETDFNQWFASDAVSKNGLANAADSIGFPPATTNTACDFYKWSSQMFLWLTSPTSSDGGLVFDSNVFFDVSPESDQKRTLISNVGLDGKAAPNSFLLRSAKPDEEIEEAGQAGGGGVLMSQNKSVVYYGIHVNDVYAYFLTGQKNGAIKASAFPDTTASIQAVKDYVKTLKGVAPLPDYNALTLELKTSWVDASSVKDPSQFVTISATVPKFTPNKTNPTTQWDLNGTQNLTLAMVGMHVVGTVKDHPEMVWATIEHISNAPDAAYYYTNNNKDKDSNTLENLSTAGNWIFTQSGVSMGLPMNQERMKVATASGSSTGNIEASKDSKTGQYDNTIGPSNTLRLNPWGNAASNTSYADNNAQLISLNNDVLGFLKTGDARKNYFLSGAVWTKNGNIPWFANSKKPKDVGPAFVEKGSISLANSTMETYHQETYTDPTKSTGCFLCHSVSTQNATPVSNGGTYNALNVSHIYSNITPLNVTQKSAK
jgi:hypothetical protein